MQYGSGPPPAKVDNTPPSEEPPFDDFGSGLSREELSALRALFDKYDADANRLLDATELGALLKEMVPHRAGDANRLLAEFRVADLNGDGTVSFEELARYYAVLKEMDPSGGLSAEEVEWLRMLFDRFDSDQDAHLTYAELGDLLRQCAPSRAQGRRKLTAEVEATRPPNPNPNPNLNLNPNRRGGRRPAHTPILLTLNY